MKPVIKKLIEEQGAAEFAKQYLPTGCLPAIIMAERRNIGSDAFLQRYAGATRDEYLKKQKEEQEWKEQAAQVDRELAETLTHAIPHDLAALRKAN